MPQTSSTAFLKPENIIPLILKYRWLIIVPFCLAVVAGSFLAVLLPKVYQARTLILIQPQKVPTDYVRSVVSADIDARISTISQQIMSRTNLEKIIADFKLFQGPEYDNMFLEDKLESLHRRISVDVTKKDRRSDTDAFSISFKGKDPSKVMQITNALATYVIDENLKVREAQAVGTSDFLEDELASIRKELESQEARLKEYREKYMGSLPEQLDSNLRILDRLQEQATAKQESLRDAKNRMVALENQTAELQNVRSEGRTVTTDSGDVMIVDTEAHQELEQARAQLADLQSRYTARHPDVIRLQKRVKKLEAEIAARPTEEPSGSAPQTPSMSLSNAQQLEKDISRLVLQMEDVKAEIRSDTEDLETLANQIRVYQRRVENTPKREQELLALERDYHNIQETYNSVLSRKLEAEISVNMEKKQKGEQFRVIDPAIVPTKPIEPDMKKLFLLTIAAGLGLGGGIVFLLEYFNTGLRDAEDAEAFLELPILSNIPAIKQPAQKRWQLINNVLSVGGVLVSGALLAAFAALTFKGVEQTLAIIRSFTSLG